MAFKGVPYAEPPVGELRWRPPRAAIPRSGWQLADRFAPRCPQSEAGHDQRARLAGDLGGDPASVPALPETSEDCLYLNVWTPDLSPGAKLPVMVWIHGGSNRWGGGDAIPADGTELARRGAVVVSFNYRLGLLGFLAHPKLSAESERNSSGNYGLLDQIALLEWVQANISSFGGDPERVTVFGASSGGADALYLMASPLSEGLLHGVVSQSGAPPADTRTLAGQEVRGSRLTEIFELHDSADVLADLRAISTERLLEVGSYHLNEEFDCAPVTDGWVLPDLPGRLFAAGKQRDVPLLVGSNADEWQSIASYSESVSVVGFQGWLASRWDGLSREAAALYPSRSSEEVAASVARWQTDDWFTCPARFIARAMDRVGSPAYLYEFALSSGAERPLGAYHGAEVAFVFDNLSAESWVPRSAAAEELADTMADYWVEFARKGDPNLAGRPAWPAFDSGGSYLELGEEISVKTALRARACNLWERRLESLINGRS